MNRRSKSRGKIPPVVKRGQRPRNGGAGWALRLARDVQIAADDIAADVGRAANIYAALGADDIQNVISVELLIAIAAMKLNKHGVPVYDILAAYSELAATLWTFNFY